jgi:hypothetical protein
VIPEKLTVPTMAAVEIHRMSRQKTIIVFVISKNLAALYSPAYDDVMQSSRRVYSRFAWRRQLVTRHGPKATYT